MPEVPAMRPMPSSSSSYYATIGARVEAPEPPTFPRAQYLDSANNSRGSVSVSEPGFVPGAPLFDLNIDDAFVFDCAADAATPAGCKTTVVSPADPRKRYACSRKPTQRRSVHVTCSVGPGEKVTS
jgi:hypothetical protein